MNELVLDIVTCYENRISMVEEWVTGEYYTTTLDASLAAVAEERASRLRITLSGWGQAQSEKADLMQQPIVSYK